METMPHLPPEYVQLRKGRAVIVVHERYRDALLACGIDSPDELLHAAAAGPSPTGRGAVPSLALPGLPGERMMVRRYLRGGLVRFVNRDLFLDPDRAFRELAITVEARRSGIPTVEILAAVSIRAAGLLYRCFLFSRELPGCLDLAAYLRARSAAEAFTAEKRAALERAAAAVRLMHDKGFFHADLNMKNILIGADDPDRLYVIDWDKSRRFTNLSQGRRSANAVRFCRSMLKLAGGTGLPVSAEDAEAFLRAYRPDEGFVRAALEQLRRSVALRSRFWKQPSR
jgi:3-deoxy-D-manno-octulosonic acid kinase